jgi:hypothetical protein
MPEAGQIISNGAGRITIKFVSKGLCEASDSLTKLSAIGPSLPGYRRRPGASRAHILFTNYPAAPPQQECPGALLLDDFGRIGSNTRFSCCKGIFQLYPSRKHLSNRFIEFYIRPVPL